MEFITNVTYKARQKIKVNIARILIIIILCLIYFIINIKFIYGDLIVIKSWFELALSLISTIIGSGLGVLMGFISSRRHDEINNNQERDKQKHAIGYLIRDEIYANRQIFTNEYFIHKTNNDDLNLSELTLFKIEDWPKVKHDIVKFNDLCKDKNILELFSLYYSLQEINIQNETKKHTQREEEKLLNIIDKKLVNCEEYIKSSINEEG